ncbi:hypothetical protein HKD37_08G023325 [Glycine soja]
MDHSIVDTAMTSRKRKREEYKKIILLAAACVVHMVIGVVTWYHNNYFVKEPTRNWELERHSFLNRLYRGTNKDCIEQLRLSKNEFFNLCRILQEKGGLVRTRNVPTTEAITMFLHILAHNLKYRVVQFSYCRSKETISRQFNDVLRAKVRKQTSEDGLRDVLEHLMGLIFRLQFLLMRDLDIETRNYFTWNLEMERVLADVLRDQRNLGNKGDGGWKRSALNAAAAVLSTSFNVNVTSDNVKNRIKLWRSWYGIVSDILGQSGFDWDGTKHMITVENENAWNEYCISHKSAKPFRYKVLQNWEDIVDLCAKDRATGHGAETAMDVDEAMSRETNEVEFMGLGATAIDLEEPSSNTKGKRQVMGEKEGITASLDKMANSFNRMVEKMDGKVDDEDIQEVLREAALIPDLNRQQWAKAIKWLADDPKQIPQLLETSFILSLFSLLASPENLRTQLSTVVSDDCIGKFVLVTGQFLPLLSLSLLTTSKTSFILDCNGKFDSIGNLLHSCKVSHSCLSLLQQFFPLHYSEKGADHKQGLESFKIERFAAVYEVKEVEYKLLRGRLYNVDSQEMESSIVDASAASRKRRRDEEEEEELEQVFFIIVSVVTMLLDALTWYHDKYFVKEPARNLELERHSFLNRLYRGTETDCIEQLRNSIGALDGIHIPVTVSTEDRPRYQMESSNVKNKSSGKRKMSSEDTKSYFAWNLEMENLGNKGDGNWKAVAYSTAAQILSKRFGVHLMADNVKNRFKLWRTWYGILHEEAKRFRFKVIPNWDDIVDLCAKDRATGLGAENALDADDIMSKETNEEEVIHSVSFDLEGSSSATRKNIRPSKSGEKEGMISSMKEVAESLKEFVEVTKKKMENKKKMEIKEAQEVVHEVVSELDNIPNFNGALRHTTIDWLTENPIKFAIIKALPLENM